ncbi:MAG: DUF3793 family protein [Lachnospiraceae bacterium]|nr:DUF3793 family protein [Lachnospiraceae bacterium]
MGTQALEILKTLDFKALSTQLVMQCAPLISGLKFSNLLTISFDKLEDLNELLKHTDICIYHLTETENRAYVLLYNESDLQAYLNNQETKGFMQTLGYMSNDVAAVLPEFKRRYSNYMKTKCDFPHEMGILLGYPLEDVVGFIVNEGKNFLCTGYWKVYKNANEKQKIFRKYEMVRETMIHLISHGLRIEEIIDIYKMAA